MNFVKRILNLDPSATPKKGMPHTNLPYTWSWKKEAIRTSTRR